MGGPVIIFFEHQFISSNRQKDIKLHNKQLLLMPLHLPFDVFFFLFPLPVLNAAKRCSASRNSNQKWPAANGAHGLCLAVMDFRIIASQ